VPDESGERPPAFGLVEPVDQVRLTGRALRLEVNCSGALCSEPNKL